ncbi:hypothetical protein [Henriciella litoralis]|uniref:hypothetical protein n=1 Tax=Henriciella litoralis TaxID=568102 RepID=UPI00111C0350|nr:hypothetical protein [Henriciella litoralis]
MAAPFRWSFAKREQLGRWLEQPTAAFRLHREDLNELRETAARILAFSDGADLAFIGRTPENFYDYLSGCFDGHLGTPALYLVPFSTRSLINSDVDTIPQPAFDGLAATLRQNGLDPQALAISERPLALVDMVAYGGTMETLVHVLHRMARESGTDWRAVQRRLRIIGLRARTKNSPNTHRWQQKQKWLGLIPDVMIKNVSAAPGFIFLIANAADKVTPTYDTPRWDAPTEGAFTPNEEQLRAMKLAAWLYDLGATREERNRLSRLITARPEMKQPATRALVAALRGKRA